MEIILNLEESIKNTKINLDKILYFNYSFLKKNYNKIFISFSEIIYYSLYNIFTTIYYFLNYISSSINPKAIFIYYYIKCSIIYLLILKEMIIFDVNLKKFNQGKIDLVI